ncbi:Gfo/Idh/MocA family oxidoreductase [Bosea sp. (in: a-proteobacteria)]|uniref:Gfo/Idh/MocA family protein n=1 Tax=Bosea sp. (in: a-proteobacteria) TaxID=1871050 RepID=UPI002621423E|nr:Gfo/Idh/MocA family oxidoreductase [Bosea sp. (in: a-proteobacteria)]MCO5090363.1 Gfo/Idh/MocA family oxidoreductase [Bosea sp. (in: a-proteobacteria)]
MRRLRVAIVGCGWVGGLHVAAGFGLLPELFEVAACCDVDAARAVGFAAEFGIARRFTDYAALLESPDIDVVSICTPPSLHYAMVMAALKAGKHAICEKPFTSSLRLMDAVIAAEAEASARVMPIFQYRFGAGIARIKHMIDSGLAGRPFISSVETAWKRGADYYKVPWRGKFATELGGVLLTQSIHIHDLFMWLMGPVARAAAFKATRVNPIEVEDCAVAALVMENGSLASLTATLGSARPVTRIRLCFEHATFERLGHDADAIRPGDDPWQIIPQRPELAQALAAKAAEVTAPAELGFARQFALFHAAIARDLPFPVTLADARRSLELITALFHADETRSVVELPIGLGHPLYEGWTPA